MKMIAYIRVSTVGQAQTGYGLDAQRKAIRAYAEAREWDVIWIVDAGQSARNIDRPGITKALALLKRRQADGLIVAKLDRLSRSMRDFADIVDLAGRQGWTLVSIDPGIDLTTPTGEMVASVLAAVAQWERRIISQRTKDALTAAKARGVKLGQPVRTPIEVAERIHRERAAGRGNYEIARGLNADGIPTVRGGRKWEWQTVNAVASRPVGPPDAPPIAGLSRDGVHLLTERERAVALLAARGVGTEVIGARLGLSVRTVQTYLGRSYLALGIHERSGLRQFRLALR